MAEDIAAASWSANPMTLTAVIAGVGFFMFMLVIRALTRSELPPGLFVPISFFYFASLFGICFMVLRYGSKTHMEPKSEKTFDTGELATPAYLSPVTTAQLEEARSFGIGSVTDRTTRTLDEVTIERK
ncbi:MAG: hypothetical protein ABL984_21240 [Pyrinomonadaceae bacterium]